MKITETIHVEGKPVGHLIVNTNSHEIEFQPAEATSLLPDQEWGSVDELRVAVVNAYSKTTKAPVVAGAPKFLPRTTNQTKGGSVNAT